jgi:peroxiredoxin
VAISADAPKDLVKLQAKLGAGVTLYADVGQKVAALWGRGGEDEESPGTYVISQGGQIRFTKLGDESGDWPKLDQVIAALP